MRAEELEQRLDRLEKKLDDTVSELRADFRDRLNTARRETRDLGGHFSSLKAEVGALEEKFDLISEYLKLCRQQNGEMAAALEAGAASLAETSRAIAGETIREEKHQAALAEQLRGQRQLQERLSTTLEEGNRRVGAFLEHLKSLEENLQAKLTDAAAAILQRVSDLDQQARQQLRSLSACAERIAQHEQQDAQRAVQVFEDLLGSERAFSDLFARLHAVGASLAGHSSSLLSERQQSVQERRRQLAARFNSMGLKLLADGRPDAAAGCFDQAHQLVPSEFEPLYNLSVARMRQSDFAQASRAVAKLLIAFPDHSLARCLNGLIALRTGDWSGAKTELSPNAPSDDADGQAAAGLACLFAGDTRSAVAIWQRAAAHNHPTSRVLGAMGFAEHACRPSS